MALLIGMIAALLLIAYVTLLVSDYMDTGKLDYKALMISVLVFVVCMIVLSCVGGR